MKIKVYKDIYNLYIKSHKNFDYAIDGILNSFDPECYEDALANILELKLNCERVELEISENIVRKIREALNLDKVKDELIEVLVWVAVLFPEI